MEPLTRDDPGQIAGYRLRARLGAGGMGVVYLGSTPGGRSVAVKVMRPELGDDRGFRERFRQEIDAARRVHGLYTAQVIDADPTAVPPWLVTAYVPGPSLQEAVAAHGPMPVQTVYQIVAGVAEALQAIHAAGVIHRDLKPSNVLLAPDGPRVIDFGIARAAEATALTHSGMRVGSPQFMAPEQVAGQPATPATDVFALGSLATYAALGRAPFGNGGAEAVLYRILHQDADLTGCPMPLRSLIERCLAKDPAQRPGPAEIIWFCQGQLAPGQAPGQAGESAQSWLPPPVAADVAYLSTLAAGPPTGPADPAGPGRPAGGPVPTPTAVATPANAGPPPSAPGPRMPGSHPPSSVIQAIQLMYAGAASAVLNAIVGSVVGYGVVHNMLERQPNVNQAAVTEGTAFDVTVTIFFGLAGTALWLWMAYASRHGRSWARILSTVLFALLTLSLPLSFIEVPDIWTRLTGLIQWALGLAALVLLWVGPSNAYFAAMRRLADRPPQWGGNGPPHQGTAGAWQEPGPFGQPRQPGKW
jgi:serine/threonine protein kinase